MDKVRDAKGDVVLDDVEPEIRDIMVKLRKVGITDFSILVIRYDIENNLNKYFFQFSPEQTSRLSEVPQIFIDVLSRKNAKAFNVFNGMLFNTHDVDLYKKIYSSLMGICIRPEEFMGKDIGYILAFPYHYMPEQIYKDFVKNFNKEELNDMRMAQYGVAVITDIKKEKK